MTPHLKCTVILFYAAHQRMSCWMAGLEFELKAWPRGQGRRANHLVSSQPLRRTCCAGLSTGRTTGAARFCPGCSPVSSAPGRSSTPGASSVRNCTLWVISFYAVFRMQLFQWTPDSGRIQGSQNCSLKSSVADPDPHVFRPSGSGSISQRYGSGSGFFYHHAKIVRKTLIPTILWLLTFYLWKMM